MNPTEESLRKTLLRTAAALMVPMADRVPTLVEVRITVDVAQLTLTSLPGELDGVAAAAQPLQQAPTRSADRPPVPDGAADLPAGPAPPATRQPLPRAPARRGRSPPSTVVSCEQQILQVLGDVGDRLNTTALLAALRSRGMERPDSEVVEALARMVQAGTLTNQRDVHKTGYGLPEWPAGRPNNPDPERRTPPCDGGP